MIRGGFDIGLLVDCLIESNPVLLTQDWSVIFKLQAAYTENLFPCWQSLHIHMQISVYKD